MTTETVRRFKPGDKITAAIHYGRHVKLSSPATVTGYSEVFPNEVLFTFDDNGDEGQWPEHKCNPVLP